MCVCVCVWVGWLGWGGGGGGHFTMDKELATVILSK